MTSKTCGDVTLGCRSGSLGKVQRWCLVDFGLFHVPYTSVMPPVVSVRLAVGIETNVFPVDYTLSTSSVRTQEFRFQLLELCGASFRTT